VIDSSTVQLELFKLVGPLLMLAAGWFVGQRIIAGWDLRKKKQELDIAAAERFQGLYGELKELSRVWRSAKNANGVLHVPTDLQWKLLVQSIKAESQFESVVIKLATERRLSEREIRSLGLFRQTCQHIRGAIEKGELIESSGFGAAYLLLNDLAAEVTCMIGATRRGDLLDPNHAKRNLEKIALIRSKDWLVAVGEYTETKVPLIYDNSNEQGASAISERGEAPTL
jgi:hypothetical protein